MINILYEDGESLVINKPAGLPIDTPRRGGASLGDHVDALKLGFQRPPLPAHRLDTDTSGCLLLARNPKALKRFNMAFEERKVAKLYWGIVAGKIAEDSGTIALSLAKTSSAEKGWRMIPAKKGKPATTHWRKCAEAGSFTLIEFRPETGRTHQIRVHAASGLGAPLLGDPIYGRGASAGGKVKRTMLHAAGIRLDRGAKSAIFARAPMPDDFISCGFSDIDFSEDALFSGAEVNGD